MICLIAISTFLLAPRVVETQILKVPVACTGFKCENNGNVSTLGDECSCICPDSHTGLQCETELKDSKWPNGPYATPMPIYGCPEVEGSGWKTGYMNMTFREKIFNSSLLSQARAQRLLGPYGNNVFQMNFCYKIPESTSFIRTNPDWPPASYGIYRAGGKCPDGFEERELHIETPEILLINTDGFLPDLALIENGSTTVLEIKTCDRLKSFNEGVIKTSWNYPFIFLQGARKEHGSASRTCPDVPRMDAALESLELLSTNVNRYAVKDATLTPIVVFKYCFYKMHIGRPDEGLRLFFSTEGVFETAKIPLAVYLESQEIPWILIDVEQTIDVTGVHIHTLEFVDRSWSWTYGDCPEIGISNARWAFLNGGAMGVDLPLEEGPYLLAQRFVRSINGRYVSVYGKGFLVSPGKTASFYMGVAEIKVYGVGRGCGKDLGLRDFGIEDFQLSASSETSDNQANEVRPNLSGWCADHSDVDPYFQVDLLVATVVEGIKVYNWATTDDVYKRNVYSVKTFPSGARSFWLEYGFSEELMKPYTTSHRRKTFWMDVSLGYHHEQAFFIQTPIVASLIRVRPDGFNFVEYSAICMKFELIGCRVIKLKTITCDERNVTFWARRSEGFVSAESYNDAKTVRSRNKTSCIEVCNGCDVVKYATNTQSCSVYNASNTGQFMRVEESSENVIYQKTCLHDPAVVPPYKTLVGFSVHYIDSFPVEMVFLLEKEIFFTSLGYPISYDTGIITKWNIHINRGFDPSGRPLPGIPHLIFTNISLNIYQLQDWYSERCEDTVDVIQHGISMTGNALTDSNYDSDFFFKKHSVSFSLNNTLNGRHVVYQANSAETEVRFYTCLRESKLTFRGRGFRVIIKLFGLPYIKSSPSISSCPFRGPFSILRTFLTASSSFNGLQDATRHDEYVLMCGRSEIITVTILYLDWKCDEEAAFYVSDYISEYKFCNLNRPILGIQTDQNYLLIRLHHGYGDSGFQGFVGRYDIAMHEHSKVALTNGTNAFVSRGFHGRRWKKGCIASFGKCFGVFRSTLLTAIEINATWGFLSASSADVKCTQMMGPTARLATIQNGKEFLYIREILWMFVWTHAKEMKIPFEKSMYNYAYIGLMWYTDSSGVLKARWRDGSPVTFSAWVPGQYLKRGDMRCTRMDGNANFEIESWEAIDCNLLAADLFVCQVDMGTAKYNLRSLHQQIYGAPIEIGEDDHYRYLRCESGELVSRLYVCDGIMDCLDGTDEALCETQDEEYSSCAQANVFQCSNGDCVSISMTCDFVPDCLDGSDENCEFPDCSTDEFQCRNRQCIPTEFVCNYIKDCWDGSDEERCTGKCRNGTYQCDDHSCIPSSRRCDGFLDCQSAEDETNCTTASMSSCLDWWKEGYKKTNVYLINNTKALCDFDMVSFDGLIRTKYYNIQATKNGQGQFVVIYENIGFVTELMEKLSCNQSLIQTCEPPEDLKDEMEGQLGLRGHRPCMCLRLVWTQNASYVEACTEGNTTVLDSHWLEDRATVLRKYRNRPVTLLEPVTPIVDSQWMKVEPIVCHEPFSGSSDKLRCVRGNFVSEDTRCLYDLDTYGDVIGCRDLTHLQNCENFTCPNGFVKCASSFCLATSYLCDGEKQCPGGQDELNCWCGFQGRFAIILHETDEQLNKAAIRLAGQLYDQSKSITSSNVGLFRYGQTGKNSSNLGPNGIKIEYTTYLPKKIDQFSEKKASLISNAVELVPYILSMFNTTPSAIILLQKEIYSPIGFHIIEMMDFDHRSLGNSTVYAVYFGKESEFRTDTYRKVFPTTTTFVHFNTGTFVTPFQFGPEVCSELPLELLPRCPGLYRCHASRQCINTTKVCDGVRQCPLGDDEKLCQFICPDGCLCDAYEVDCSSLRASVKALSSLSNQTRSLDLHSNEFHSFEFEASDFPLLISLNMSYCSMHDLPESFFESMGNIRTLDLSFNQITSLKSTDFSKKIHLTSLMLIGNFELIIIEPKCFHDLSSLNNLAIKGSKLTRLEPYMFRNINVTSLDLSDNRIYSVDENAFSGAYVKNLDISNNQISNFSSRMFEGISNLKTLKTDSGSLCCFRPSTVKEIDCYPARDEFSSCTNLIESELLKDGFWAIGACALLGNFLSLIYRLRWNCKNLRLGYGILVTNLALADFLMGVYLLLIVTASFAFNGRYGEMEDWWRTSFWCGLAGLLATLSVEASLMFICLLTIDRILVIKYPFGDLRFTRKKAIVAVAITWFIASNIAMIPIWVAYYNGQFTSKSPVCLLLPISRRITAGWAVPTAVFSCIGIMAVVLTVFGLLNIHRNGEEKRMTKTTTHRSRDLNVSHNLLLIISLDLFSWFPFWTKGLIALSGLTLSSDNYNMVTALMLTVNSALNPILYTVSAIIRKEMFSPSLDELSTEIVYTKGLVTKTVKVWNTRLFCQRHSIIHGYTLLSDHLFEHHMRPIEILRVALRLAQAFDELHCLELVQRDFQINDITIRKSEDIVTDVVVRISPRLASSEADKRNDMERVGQILSVLFAKRTRS